MRAHVRAQKHSLGSLADIKMLLLLGCLVGPRVVSPQVTHSTGNAPIVGGWQTCCRLTTQSFTWGINREALITQEIVT